jgi:hypothetical protein
VDNLARNGSIAFSGCFVAPSAELILLECHPNGGATAWQTLAVSEKNGGGGRFPVKAIEPHCPLAPSKRRSA